MFALCQGRCPESECLRPPGSLHGLVHSSGSLWVSEASGQAAAMLRLASWEELLFCNTQSVRTQAFILRACVRAS